MLFLLYTTIFYLFYLYLKMIHNGKEEKKKCDLLVHHSICNHMLNRYFNWKKNCFFVSPFPYPIESNPLWRTLMRYSYIDSVRLQQRNGSTWRPETRPIPLMEYIVLKSSRTLIKPRPRGRQTSGRTSGMEISPCHFNNNAK